MYFGEFDFFRVARGVDVDLRWALPALRELLLMDLRLVAMKIPNSRDWPTYFRALARVNGRETICFYAGVVRSA